MAESHEPACDSRTTGGVSAAKSTEFPDSLTPLGLELGPDLVPLRALGHDRSGQRFLAREPRLNRLVAVKVLVPDLLHDPVARARFEREARAAAALNHPNAVAVYRFGYLRNGAPYIVMQYIKGEKTLADKVAAEGLLSVSQARRALAEVASALAAAHQQGFVHRDLRPGTVLCEEESGRVLITDFGLAGLLPSAGALEARLTRAGEVLAVPEYASPEQLLGKEPSGGSDVYALGVMGYRLLTGQGPFAATQAPALMAAHLDEPPRSLRLLRSDVDQSLAELLERCLAKDPQKRPSAAYLAQALGAGVQSNGTSPPITRPSPGAEPVGVLEALLGRRLPQVVAATAIVGFAVLNFVDQLVDRHVIPETVYHLLLATVISGIAGAIAVAWFHGRPGRQRVSTLELAVLASIAVAWLVACVIVIL